MARPSFAGGLRGRDMPARQAPLEPGLFRAMDPTLPALHRAEAMSLDDPCAGSELQAFGLTIAVTLRLSRHAKSNQQIEPARVNKLNKDINAALADPGAC
jgi:hypothetical protein